MKKFLCIMAGAFALALVSKPTVSVADTSARKVADIRVVVWDERQEAQKTAYPNYLGNFLAEQLSAAGGFKVTSVGLNDPNQGLTSEILDNTDVLVWWGHQKHGDVKDELAMDIAKRVQAGKLGLVALHSAHFSKPFTMLMDARTLEDVEKSLTPEERKKAKIITHPARRSTVKPTDPKTPNWTKIVQADGSVTVDVNLPVCCFYTVHAEGLPSHITTLLPKHAIAKGLPANFTIPHTEVYGGVFQVPTPDATIFGEKWDTNEEFTAGCAWKVGKGRVFYYRPGHETFHVFQQKENMTIVENAVKYVAPRGR
ncbi:MAG: ThuA domain-containing protein [Chthonomonadales bacterium]